jgi:REP-associated tyrosine transposase
MTKSKSSWGGRREGAGRPVTVGVVPRKRRPNVSGKVKVTLKLNPGITVRIGQVKEAVEEGSERFGMRVLDFSIKGDRIHIAADVKNKKALSRGVQGLTIRLARAINRTSTHHGKVFADRYDVEE